MSVLGIMGRSFPIDSISTRNYLRSDLEYRSQQNMKPIFFVAKLSFDNMNVMIPVIGRKNTSNTTITIEKGSKIIILILDNLGKSIATVNVSKRFSTASSLSYDGIMIATARFSVM